MSYLQFVTQCEISLYSTHQPIILIVASQITNELTVATLQSMKNAT